jgi:hypothetical protein
MLWGVQERDGAAGEAVEPAAVAPAHEKVLHQLAVGVR